MSETSQLRVEIDDRIRQNPSLLASVELATEELDRLCADYPNVFGDDRTLAWRLQESLNNGTRLAVVYSEADRYGSRSATRRVTLGEMADAVSRDNAISRLIETVLRQRWDQIDQSFQKHLRELEEDEERNGHAE